MKKKTNPNDKILAFRFNPADPKNAEWYAIEPSEVTGLTFAPDGEMFANLKNFRQARIRANDYFRLKEEMSCQLSMSTSGTATSKPGSR